MLNMFSHKKNQGFSLVFLRISCFGPNTYANSKDSDYCNKHFHGEIGKNAVVFGLKTAFNPFTPEFMKWTLPSLNLNISIVANRDVSQKSKQNGKQCRSLL